MSLILRKCWKNGLSRRNFYYGNVGDIVTAPDWNPEPKCGNGIHGLLEGNGDWHLLEGEHWLVIEADEIDIVNIDNYKCKFRTGKILFRGTREELASSEFYAKFNLNECAAYNWAMKIGNHEMMIDKITDEGLAYHWALNIGNQDIMMPKITSENYAYLWARDIGNQDIMMPKITNSRYAFYWIVNFGNYKLMVSKVQSAYYKSLLEYYVSLSRVDVNS